MNKSILLTYFHLCVIVCCLSTSAEMDQLRVLMEGLLSESPELGLSISGVARVREPGNSVYYSVSLVPPKNSTFVPPEIYMPKFQARPLAGFVFKKVQTLEFDSKLPLPKPSWRVQVIYKSA